MKLFYNLKEVGLFPVQAISYKLACTATMVRAATTGVGFTLEMATRAKTQLTLILAHDHG